MQALDNILRLACLPILPVIPAACASLPEATAPDVPPAPTAQEIPHQTTIHAAPGSIVLAGVDTGGGDIYIGVDPAQPAVTVATVEDDPTFEEALADSVVRHEGWETDPYVLDGLEHICAGLLTGGGAESMTNQECIVAVRDYMLDTAIPDAMEFVGEYTWESLSEGRQAVLAELAMMVGGPRLRQFDRLLEALHSGDWPAAADEIGDSRLPDQVGQARVTALQQKMLEG